MPAGWVIWVTTGIARFRKSKLNQGQISKLIGMVQPVKRKNLDKHNLRKFESHPIFVVVESSWIGE